ncbi:hypothetical protein AGMMS50212_04980 [Spirochaetia bacterium]|nr:hypothetical protein AGMMS50212_04980 [Spirochaetia bacterium]
MIKIKAVITAGGKGTRIASLQPDIPKPMIKILGKPILEYQIDCLKKYGITDIILVVGYLSGKIKDYFGNGEKFGVCIDYWTETEPLGSAGALFKIQGRLTEDFLFINGDIVFDIDFPRFIEFYKTKKAFAALLIHPNSHPFDSSLLVTDKDERVIKWLNKDDEREIYKNQVNAGIHIVSKRLLGLIKVESEKLDFDRDIIKPNIERCGIYAYNTTEYVLDMGTPERLGKAARDIERGFVVKKNLSLKQKAFFLDRDGTINKTNGFVRRAEDFELIEGVAESIKKINDSGCLAIVITNQPVIARGGCTLEELDRIHQKLETELGKKGAYIDALYFCPHHPDKGFEGEIAEYKIDCGCRKPKPGMILAAAKKFNIDLSLSYMVGDSFRDWGAGLAAGCKSVFLSRGVDIKTLPRPTPKEVLVFDNLKDFMDSVDL